MDSMAKEYNVNLQILKFWYGQLHGTGSMQSMVFIAKDEKVFMTDEIIFPRVCVLPGRKNITNELKSFVYHLRNSLSVLRVASKQTIFTVCSLHILPISTSIKNFLTDLSWEKI
ncbi:uncharacterized protein A4U43_C03F18490 [Asparagus officinalis]|uniref:Uncharacterized protein n=1 Tax=Asparagus officinalis TaxID=4686 RepID=A0A5P1FFF3_ASPOF|nr:uncharacterized protein A4U43_C03F18490 [Asparagus officinalis]